MERLKKLTLTHVIEHLAHHVAESWESADKAPEISKLMKQLLDTTAAVNQDTLLEHALDRFCNQQDTSNAISTVCPSLTLLIAISYIDRLNKVHTILLLLLCSILPTTTWLISLQCVHRIMQTSKAQMDVPIDLLLWHTWLQPNTCVPISGSSTLMKIKKKRVAFRIIATELIHDFHAWRLNSCISSTIIYLWRNPNNSSGGLKLGRISLLSSSSNTSKKSSSQHLMNSKAATDSNKDCKRSL